MFRTLIATVLVAFLPLWAGAQDAAVPADTGIAAGVSGARTVLNEIDTAAFPRIRLFGTVTRNGDPVTGLKSHDFWVRENGITQSPLVATEELPPLSVAVTIDASGSIRSAIEDVRAAAAAFVDGLSPDDAAMVLTFSDEIEILTGMTTDRAALQAAIAGIQVSGDTALYDGIGASIHALSEREGRKAIVLLSDGRDDNGAGAPLSALSLDGALAMAARINVPVFVIGLGDNLDEPALRRIADESGGLYLPAESASDLGPVYREIGEVLTGQYSISYTSSLPSPEWPREVVLEAQGARGSKTYDFDSLRTGGRDGDSLSGSPEADVIGGGTGDALAGGALPRGAADAGAAGDLAQIMGEDGAEGAGGRFDMSDTGGGAGDDAGGIAPALPPGLDPADAALAAKALEDIANGAGTITGAEVELVLRAGSGGLNCALAPVMATEADAISAADAQFAAGVIDAATRDANKAASIEAMTAAISTETSASCLEAALKLATAMRAGGYISAEGMDAIARAVAAAQAAICVTPDGQPAPGATCDIDLNVVIEGAAEDAPADALPEEEPEGLFDFILRKIVEYLGPLGPVILMAGLAFVLILSTIPFLLKKEEDPLDRLKRIKTTAEPDDKKKGKGTVRLRTKSKNEDKLAKYSNFLEPKNAAEYSAIQLKLMQAGYRSKNAVRLYHFAQFALGLLLLLVGVLYAIYSSATGEPTTQDLAMSILIPGAIGYMGPKYWVNKRQEKRKEEITNGFPDALDMMLVCVEAGQSLDQSIIRVAKEIRAGFPALADEFEIVAWEIKAGKDKINVLRDMSERAGVPDVASFVTVLIQSASFGTSVAEALRVYASEMRDKRVMRAEEKANTLPTKMTLATMMLTVPPLLIILLGPSVYNIAETLGSMGK